VSRSRRGSLFGLLDFVDGRERPEYVPWAEVGRVDLDRPQTF
jgi:hypothetical protein